MPLLTNGKCKNNINVNTLPNHYIEPYTTGYVTLSRYQLIKLLDFTNCVLYFVSINAIYFVMLLSVLGVVSLSKLGDTSIIIVDPNVNHRDRSQVSSSVQALTSYVFLVTVYAASGVGERDGT